MTVNFSNLQTTKWNVDGYRSYPALKLDNSQLITVDNTKEAKNDEVKLSKDCTDGKDDGKIGLLSAGWNILKGAGNTAIDTVKGCFTDEKGDFSVGRTLLTAGTMVACAAFPPLALAACAVGGAVGIAKIGSGVVNAVNAKTDAEAKQAWQNIGEGALTTGASALGARASLGAVKSASTAGGNGLSALETLGENASLTEKALALGKDALSSSKNNANAIKTHLKSAKETIQAGKEAVDLKIAQAKAGKIEGGALTNKEASIIKEAEIREAFLSDKAKVFASKMDNAKATITNKAGDVKTSAKNILPSIKEGAKHPIQTIKSGLDKIKSVSLKDIKTNLSENAKGAFNTIKEKGYSNALNEYGYGAVYEALEAASGVEVVSNAV